MLMLLSARISADIAVASARELFRSGWRTPQKMRDTTLQLEKNATYLLDTWYGDLRELPPGSDGRVDVLVERLTGFPRIGSPGHRSSAARCRDVWPEVTPFFD